MIRAFVRQASFLRRPRSRDGLAASLGPSMHQTSTGSTACEAAALAACCRHHAGDRHLSQAGTPIGPNDLGMGYARPDEPAARSRRTTGVSSVACPVSRSSIGASDGTVRAPRHAARRHQCTPALRHASWAARCEASMPPRSRQLLVDEVRCSRSAGVPLLTPRTPGGRPGRCSGAARASSACPCRWPRPSPAAPRSGRSSPRGPRGRGVCRRCP
jgi:hypothetical protein